MEKVMVKTFTEYESGKVDTNNKKYRVIGYYC